MKSLKKRLDKIDPQRNVSPYDNPDFLKGAKVDKPNGKVNAAKFITPKGKCTS